MHITDNFLLISTLFVGIGAVFFIWGLVLVIHYGDYTKPSDLSFIIPATFAVIGAITAVSAFNWNSSNANDLNKQFASQLQDQYGAVSDKSYTDLFKSEDRIATFTKGDEKKQVQIVFETINDLKFTEISNTPYK